MLKRLRKHARPLARFGCVSIGTVYVLVGTLALLALSGVLTGAADEDRMVHVVMGVPGGTILIWIIILGLAGYVLWRAAEVVADPYEFGNDPGGLATRAGIGLSALAYGFVAFSAGRIAAGGGGSGGDASEERQQMLVAQVLGWPGGDWLVGVAGAIVVAVGLLQFVLVARGGYSTEIRMATCSRPMQNLIRTLAWYGYAARGVILCVLGYFLIRGAVRHDPEAVGDTDTAFDFIGGGVVGDSAFFVVALGTLAYGFFMYLNAWYYRFDRKPDRAWHGMRSLPR